MYKRQDLYRRKSEFYETAPADSYIKRLWPELNSLNWFLKHNSDKITKAGGARRLGRDWFIHIEKFESAVAEIYGLKVKKAA